MGSVVELAAWIIIAEAITRLVVNEYRQKQREIEKCAVEAEYQKCEEMLCDSSSEASERIWSRRKEELRICYPQHLIRMPDPRHFAEARRQVKADRKESKLRIPSYLAVALGILIWAAYHYLIK